MNHFLLVGNQIFITTTNLQNQESNKGHFFLNSVNKSNNFIIFLYLFEEIWNRQKIENQRISLLEVIYKNWDPQI